MKVKQKEIETERKNKIIHEKRVQLTKDFQKSEEVWKEAKKKSQANKVALVQSFATNLIDLAKHFNYTKSLEKEEHSVDLKEGYDNTARLFFNTLEKFNIRRTEVKEGDKTKSSDEFEVLSKQKAEKNEQKDTVAKVVDQGWLAEGKTIVKAKVILYQ